MENLAVSDTLFFRGDVKEPATETGYESLVKQTAAGLNELTVMVSGVHCAACIQKIESALNRQPEIKQVHLNFTSGKLSFNWEGAPAKANEYVRIVEGLGYGVKPFDPKVFDTEQHREERFLLLCLGVAGFAMGNIMLLSVGVWSTSAETMGMATRDLLHWISALIALPTILFSGRPFFRSALNALSKWKTNMDVPISLAILLASGMSLFEVFNHGEHVYFDSAVMLTFFLLIGRYLDFKARQNARSSAHNLLNSLQGFASVLENGQIRRVLIRDLKEGMRVQVSTGEKIPADGRIMQGESTIDTSLITGETTPQDVAKDDAVYAGTLNLSAPLVMTVAKVTEDTLLAEIGKLMDKASQSQAAYVRLADKAARLYTPVVHTLALAAFCLWFFAGGLPWQEALLIAVTVLIITCPCALGLAVPVAQVLAIARLMKKGIFVKAGDALERLHNVDTVIFDKTGTITYGSLKLQGQYDQKHLQLAASLAALSAHPLSKAILGAYYGPLLEMKDVKEEEGKGLQAWHEGAHIRLGSRKWCGDADAPCTGHIEIWLDINGKSQTCLLFEDRIRNDAAITIAKIKEAGLVPILCSGDRAPVVQSVAEQLGLEQYFAEQTPADKYRLVEELQKNGHRVLMVGDGLNDAPVLAKADASIAPGSAIDLAQQSADIVFNGEALMNVMDIIKVARQTQKIIKQNFTLAVFYNAVAIPLAVLGMVTPLIAALAMSGSSLLVIANSFRLKL